MSDPMAEDELESILHLNGCQQRTAGRNEALDGKDLDMEDMERLEKLTLQEVRAYTTNKIIEARIEEIGAVELTSGHRNVQTYIHGGLKPLTVKERFKELKALNHRKE